MSEALTPEERADRMVNSGRAMNRPIPDEPDYRLVGFVVPNDIAGWYDGVHALGLVRDAWNRRSSPAQAAMPWQPRHTNNSPELFAHPAPSVPPPGDVGTLVERLRSLAEVRVACFSGLGKEKTTEWVAASLLTAQAAEIRTLRNAGVSLLDRSEAAEAALASAKAEVERLIRTATLLYSNSLACAIKHHGIDEHGPLPGWLADSEAAINRARSLLWPSEEPK